MLLGWSRVGEIARRTKNSFIIAFGLDGDGDLEAVKARRMAFWPSVEPYVRGRASDSDTACSFSSYEQACVHLALVECNADRSHTRWITWTSAFGTIAYVLMVVGVLHSIGALSLLSVLSFIGFFAVAVFVMLTAVPFYSLPWPRMTAVTIGGLVTVLLASTLIDGSPVPQIYAGRPASEVLAALIAVTLFGPYSLILVLVFYPLASSSALRIRTDDLHDDAYALCDMSELVDFLAVEGSLATADDRGIISARIGLIVDYFGRVLAGRAVAGEITQERFYGAARYVGELRSWVDLPQKGTRLELLSRIGDLAAISITGYLHELPYSPPESDESDGKASKAGAQPPSTSSVVRKSAFSATSLLRTGLTAILPVLVFLLWDSYGPGLPAQINQWIGALCVLWLVVRAMAALDPGYLKSWADLRSIVASPEIRRDSEKSA